MFKKTLITLIPLCVFITLVVLFSQGLQRDPSLIPSALLQQNLPDFQLTDLSEPSIVYDKSAILGEVALINVWASWCPSCKLEHPLLMQLAAQTDVPIYGLNYQDNRANALAVLADTGNPYTLNLYDGAGRTAIDWGVMATPETFVIDAKGVIHYRHVGIITVDVWQNTLSPLIESLRSTSEDT